MDATIRFRLLQASMGILGMFLAMSGLFAGVFLAGQWMQTEENIAIWNIVIIFIIAIWIVCIPLLIIAIMKYRKSELTNPTGLTKLYFRRRDAKQCTICQKHPVSKIYHLRSEHKLKDFNFEDYFRDCGCDKCAIYNKSEMG